MQLKPAVSQSSGGQRLDGVSGPTFLNFVFHCKIQVDRCDARNSLAIDLLRVDRRIERKGSKNRQLVPSIIPARVQPMVGFCKTSSLSRRQGLLKIPAFFHPRQDKVGRAIQDPG